MFKQSVFLFVPGGWHGGWCFRKVADDLRKAGHIVFCPSLTGLGDRAHLVHRGIDLDLHIQDIVSVIDSEELEDIVLIGHSYGGCVISGVSQLRAEKIKTLVFLDAIVLANGECLIDHLGPELTASLVESAQVHGDGYLVPIPPMDFLAIEPVHADWMMRRLTPHPLGTATQPLNVADIGKHIQKVYIDCDSPSHPATILSKARLMHQEDWIYQTLHTGHDCFVSDPQLVSKTLLGLLN
jgi:pimeloyl-ACP methyl ester carboxylesterase